MSLLASSRRPNGSTLKQSATAGDAPDPLAVLEHLLGSNDVRLAGQSKLANGTIEDTSADAFESELDFEGLGLRAFVSKYDEEEEEEPSRTTQSVEECTVYLLDGTWLEANPCFS